MRAIVRAIVDGREIDLGTVEARDGELTIPDELDWLVDDLGEPKNPAVYIRHMVQAYRSPYLWVDVEDEDEKLARVLESTKRAVQWTRPE